MIFIYFTPRFKRLDYSLLKYHQVMSAKHHQNKTNVKKRKLEDGHQNVSSCKIYNNKDYMKFCKENAADSFQNTTVHSSKGIDELGTYLLIILILEYVIF